MEHQAKSIRPFIGAKNFDLSRSFYRYLGFRETELSPQLSLFSTGSTAFYLQDAYVKDWIENTMIFLEVQDADKYWEELSALGLSGKFENVKLSPIRTEDWGKECFLHDPAGNLWHFGQFST